MARCAIAAVVPSPNLSLMSVWWLETVFGLRCSERAQSVSVSPFESSRKISNSGCVSEQLAVDHLAPHQALRQVGAEVAVAFDD